MEMKLMSGRVVVLTGACGFLGTEFVSECLEKGAFVVAADILKSCPEKHICFLNEFSENYAYCTTDITSELSLNNLLEFSVKKFGKVDVIVSNAYPRNKNYGRKFEDVTYPDFCENVSMHLGGYFLTSRIFCEYFKKQGSGNVINISSIYGVIPPRFEIYDNTPMTMPVEYAAIKSAVIHLTRYLAAYYKNCGIRANCISLGGLEAGQPESFLEGYKKYCSSKGMLDPVDVCGALGFLLSDASKYVNGQNLIVDDGFTL